MNSPQGGSMYDGGIVSVDDAAVASSVIKALRSSSNSNRHYKQNASRDDHLINNIDDFNKIIAEKVSEVTKYNALEQQMNESLSNYIPPKQPMEIVSSPQHRPVCVLVSTI
jgi:hypothetical protein